MMFLISCTHKITESGKASYYADKFEGRQTSNGETFKQRKKTAAHRTLPFGTKVTVKNLSNGRTVKVRINDRGPFVKGRMIDLSKKAAKKIDMVNAGVANVEIRYKGGVVK
ncbi:MAG: rare lipoprotein [Segetibacter sp.]|nr:rare lipoprotein [Segetibacter sp.]